MRLIDTIIIHAAATPPDWREGQSAEAKRDEIRRWHLDRGFNNIGYHHVIDRDGTIVPGRPIDQTGAHVKGHNTGSIGVVLMGGKGSKPTDKFSDHYTPEQDAALRRYIADQKRRFPGIVTIAGHNDYTTAKACPGFKVSQWLREAPVIAPKAPAQPDPAEQPQGLWAALMAALTAFLERFKR